MVDDPTGSGGTGGRGLLNFVVKITRVWLPIGVALIGVGLIVVGGTNAAGAVSNGSIASAIGVCLLIVALIIWMLNWMFRLSVESNRDRDREEEAREYFDLHGHWPGEE